MAKGGLFMLGGWGSSYSLLCMLLRVRTPCLCFVFIGKSQSYWCVMYLLCKRLTNLLWVSSCNGVVLLMHDIVIESCGSEGCPVFLNAGDFSCMLVDDIALGREVNLLNLQSSFEKKFVNKVLSMVFILKRRAIRCKQVYNLVHHFSAMN